MTKNNETNINVNTSGGAHIEGDVHTGTFVGRDFNINLPHGQLPSALHQLDPVPTHFTGREAQIEQLCTTIRDGAAQGQVSTITSSIEGMGGIGKTTLAMVVGHRLKNDFPDAQLVVRLGAHSAAPIAAEEGRDQVLRSFYPNDKLPDDESTLWNLFRDALNGKSALLILDDAKDDAQIQRLLPPAGCATIITSRRNLSVGKSVRLGVLPRADAVAYLRAMCQRLSNLEARALADACGDLPIAMRVAGSYLATRSNCDPTDYIRDLREGKTFERLSEVERVFAYSYKSLTLLQREVFCALSVMPTDFDRVAALAVARPTSNRLTNLVNQARKLLNKDAAETESVENCLHELVALNLLDYDEQNKRYRWHDLLREFAAIQLSAQARHAASLRHAKHSIRIARTAQEFYLKGSQDVLPGLALFDRERVHIEKAFSNLVEMQKLNMASVEINQFLIDLVSSVHYLLEIRLFPEQRVNWLRVEIDAASRIGARRVEGLALAILSGVCVEIDARKAVEYAKQAILIANEVREHLIKSVAFGNLGWAYATLGNTSEAAEAYGMALSVARELGDRHAEGMILSGLGTVHAVLGETHKAVEFYAQALAVGRDIGDPQVVNLTLTNLGTTYASLGDLRRVIEIYEQGLLFARAIGDQRSEDYILANLRTVYDNLGDSQKDSEFYKQALLTPRVSDSEPSDRALQSSGNIDYSLANSHKTIEFYQGSLAIAQRANDRIGKWRALKQLGDSYEGLGDQLKAIEFYKQAHTVLNAIGDRVNEVYVLRAIGHCYKTLDDIPQAAKSYDQALAIAREVGFRRGESLMLISLGNLRSDDDANEQAIKLYEQALSIAQKVGDRSSEEEALSGIGVAHHNLRDIRRAIAFYERALNVAHEIGDRREESLMLKNLGGACYSLGDIQEAIKWYEQALPILRELNDQHREAVMLSSICVAYHAVGDMRKASEFGEQALPLLHRNGEQGTEMVTLLFLGMAFDALGDKSKAAKNYEQSLAIALQIGDQKTEMTALTALGSDYMSLGQISKAVELYKAAQAVARKVGNREFEAVTSWELGVAYEKLGELEKAVVEMKVYIDLCREISFADAEPKSAHFMKLRRKLSDGSVEGRQA